jgi:hypothetical protein
LYTVQALNQHAHFVGCRAADTPNVPNTPAVDCYCQCATRITACPSNHLHPANHHLCAAMFSNCATVWACMLCLVAGPTLIARRYSVAQYLAAPVAVRQGRTPVYCRSWAGVWSLQLCSCIEHRVRTFAGQPALLSQGIGRPPKVNNVERVTLPAIRVECIRTGHALPRRQAIRNDRLGV